MSLLRAAFFEKRMNGRNGGSMVSLESPPMVILCVLLFKFFNEEGVKGESFARFIGLASACATGVWWLIFGLDLVEEWS
jgi:hypothetical protein